VLVRPSGTEPVIRVMAEGDDPILIEQIVDEIAGAVSASASA
jgi:phosphoglucosamine mutase